MNFITVTYSKWHQFVYYRFSWILVT